jgi:hypothetical protein
MNPEKFVLPFQPADSRRANPLYRLCFTDPNVNDEAKQRAEQILKDNEAL